MGLRKKRCGGCGKLYYLVKGVGRYRVYGKTGYVLRCPDCMFRLKHPQILFSDLSPDQDLIIPSVSFLRQIEAKLNLEWLIKKARLSNNEQKILFLRNDDYSFREIANTDMGGINYTYETVRQIYQKTMQRLKTIAQQKIFNF